MALSDDCSDFVDGLHSTLARFQGHVADYHDAPWCYDAQTLAVVRKAIERITSALTVIDSVRQELDKPPTG